MICKDFCNIHCSCSDCPNIQFDEASAFYSDDVACDMGYSRLDCSECSYNDDFCSCADCLFLGSGDCPEFGKWFIID